MSDFNNKLVIDLFEERDALKADVVRLTLKVAELYKGAEEQKQRIHRLEYAGHQLLLWLDRNTPATVRNDWIKAKEAKP